MPLPTPNKLYYSLYDDTGNLVGVSGSTVAPGIFNVWDYGATEADLGPGVLGALQAVQANGHGTVYIPPLKDGKAWVWKTPVSINFIVDGNAQTPSSFAILGSRTRINVDFGSGTGNALLGLNNATCPVEIGGFIWVGNASATTDSPNIVRVASADSFYGHDMVFYGTSTANDNGHIFASCSQWIRVERVRFSGCQQTTGSNTGLLTLSCQVIDLENVEVADLGGFGAGNSDGGRFSERTGNLCDVAIQSCYVASFRNCFFDEATVNQILLVPTSSNAMGYVYFKTCHINWSSTAHPTIVSDGTNAAGGQILGLTFEDCYFTLGTSSAQHMTVTNVREFTMRRCQTKDAATTITCGPGVGTVLLEQLTGLAWTFDTSSHYPTTYYSVDGVEVPFRVNRAGQPYTLLPSQLNVLADVSGGAIGLTVPATTTVTDGRRMTLAVPAGDASLNNITLTRAGADTLQDPANVAAALGNTVTYATKGGSATWEACATEQQWRVVSKVS